MNINNMISTANLENLAVDSEKLATNYGEIAFDCFGLEGATPKTVIETYSPLAAWLMSTSLTKTILGYAQNGQRGLHKVDGTWNVEVPRSIWTELPDDTSGECCWHSIDFAKCSDTVPVHLLCLKDCEGILDELINSKKKVDKSTAFTDIAGVNMSFEEVRKRVAKLSFAFFTANNIINGHTGASTYMLKPFHGLVEVVENPAVIGISGCDVLSGFDSVGCRLNILGQGQRIFATNPLTYSAIKLRITPDQYGRLPVGWENRNGKLTFMGIPFVEDNHFPVDLESGTGEVWMLDGLETGLFYGSDLYVGEEFTRHSGLKQADNADCGSSCDYYYNYGAVINRNANKLAVISNIPLSNICLSAIGDLAGTIVPETLIPSGPVVVPDATLSDLQIVGLTLSPTFDKDTTSYTATTTDTSNAVLAETTDSKAKVSIKVGDTYYESGDSITWTSGSNTVEVVVNNRTESKTYTITVSAS